MTKQAFFILIGVFLWCSSLRLVSAQKGTEQKQDQQATTLFLEIARITRLPVAAQKEELPHLYKDVLPQVYMRTYSIGMPVELGKIEARLQTERPETVVGEIEQQGGWPFVQEAARDLCLKLLGDHIMALKPLLMTSLTSHEVAERAQALDLIRDACGWEVQRHPERWRDFPGNFIQQQRMAILKSPLQVYATPVLHLYFTDPDPFIASRVRYTLSALQSPSILQSLITCVGKGRIRPDLPEILQRLCEQRIPPPKLLRALQSPDENIRRTAATVLTLSGDHLLVPYVKQLASDDDPNIRLTSALMGTHLSSADWETVRPVLLALLTDSVGWVRGRACGLLAEREGKKIARTLLGLVQDDMIPMDAHFYVYDAIRHITGEDFGYVDGYFRDESWRPTTPENRVAIRKFAVWVQANTAPEK